MKTAEQIAKETLTRSTRNPMDIVAHIVHAIEADRAQRSPEPEPNDYVVDIASGVAIKLASARIVRNFSPELHAEDPEAIVFYAEAHGRVIA